MKFGKGRGLGQICVKQGASPKRISGRFVKIPRYKNGFVGIISTALLVAAALVQSCAVIRPPEGGPSDTTGPEIVAFSPAQRTVNFSETTITLEFSEYVNKSAVAQNLFISPPAATELGWSGRELEIAFTEPLAPNTSYAVTLGTELTDLRNNKPTQAFTLIFSTGATIDSGIIRGEIFSPHPEGTYLFLYPLAGVNPDTLNPSHTKPKYFTQAGTNGKFEFAALADGLYRLLAVRDEFKNRLYDAGVDGFGAPWGEAAVTSGATTVVNLLCGPPVDTLGPLLYNVRALSSRMVEASFSENLDTASVRPAAFAAADSASGQTITVLHTYFGSNAKTVNIILADEAERPPKLRLQAVADTSLAVNDAAGNHLRDTLNLRYIATSQRSDTTPVKLLGFSPSDSARNVEMSPVFEITFSAPTDADAAGATLIDATAKRSLALDVQNIQGTTLRLRPAVPLEPNRWFEMQIPFRGVRSWNGAKLRDTMVFVRFQTVDKRMTGKVRATLNDVAYSSEATAGYMLTLISDDRKRRFSQKIVTPGEVEFSDIPEGKYTFEAFAVRKPVGSDGYFYGSAFPYRPAWRFHRDATTITVRPRWTVEGVTIEFGR